MLPTQLQWPVKELQTTDTCSHAVGQVGRAKERGHSLSVPHDDKRDVVVDLLRPDMRHQIGDDPLSDLIGGAAAMTARTLAKALEAEQPAARTFRLRNTIRVENDDIAVVEGDVAGGDKWQNIRLQANRQAEIHGVDPVDRAVGPHNHDFLVLARDRHAPIVEVEEAKRQMLAANGSRDVLVHGAIQPIEEAPRIAFARLVQRADSRLNHQHQHTALESVPGDVADPDLDARIALQHVVVVAADLVDRPHEGRDLDAWNRFEFARLWQQHHLDLARGLELGAKTKVLAMELIDQRGELLAGFV